MILFKTFFQLEADSGVTRKNAISLLFLEGVALIWNVPNVLSWLRHHMETFSALLAFYVGNPPMAGGFPRAQRPVTRSFDVFFDLRLNRRLSKQWRRRRFETPLRSLWRHCNVVITFVGISWTTTIWWRARDRPYWWKSRLVQVIVWCRQTTSRYLRYVILVLCHHMSSLSQGEINQLAQKNL